MMPLQKKKKKSAETQTTMAVWTGLSSQSGKTCQRRRWIGVGGGDREPRGEEMTASCVVGVCVFWQRLRGDHASRGGTGSCPWRDPV